MSENLNNTLKGIYGSLTDEQKEKAKACKTADELMALAGDWGVELPDEVLDAVAGGGGSCFKIFTVTGYDGSSSGC